MKLGNNLIAKIPKSIYNQCKNFVLNYKEKDITEIYLISILIIKNGKKMIINLRNYYRYS